MAQHPLRPPLANQSFHVLDEHLRPRPDWVAGELYIGGTGLAQRYLGDPATTAERFIHHPDTGERLYRTGDLGRYLPDGTIEFLGRADLQIKIVAELRAHLSGRLPDYMLPAELQVVDALPLTGNGKVDLSPMKAVRVDVAVRTTTAQPSVTWDEFDAATQRFGLATPGGHGPEVGIVGYTLGGGIGELSRTLGLACDNVESFGVVTSLRFRVHPVTDIVCGPMVFAAAGAFRSRDLAVRALPAAAQLVWAARGS